MDRTIPNRNTCKCPSIKTEVNVSDHIRMPGERLLVHSRDAIPQTDGLVRTPTGESGAIGTECHTIDRTFMPIDCRRMPYKCLLVVTRDAIPQADGIVPTPIGEGGAIRAKRDAIDLCLMSLE